MARSRPLAIDLFCGLFGWSDGLVAEGFDVIGFDLEDMCGQFGFDRPHRAQLVIQDVLTLHGSQFRDAALIVASPPCQEYSYMAMPWKKAKAKAAAIRADKTGAALERLNRLFVACFRIQREACEAAGHHIPLLVENVRGAEPWVGRARWSYGSFMLWGDVPALMPTTVRQAWWYVVPRLSKRPRPAQSRLQIQGAQTCQRHDRQDTAAAQPAHRGHIPSTRMPMHWFDNAIQLPNGIMCYRHRVMFVQWRVTRDGRDDLTSRGCPVCVGLIRAEVQRDMQADARGYYHAGRKRRKTQ